MSGLQRAMRHPDRRSEARARALVSDRLVAPLSGEDAAWLRGHLETCSACRRAAEAFAADRAKILVLREELPVAPRDLGARLSRALDVEVRRAVREEARRGRRSFVATPSFALAGMAIAAALAIVFLPLAIANFGTGGATTFPAPGGSHPPAATPMVLETQAVAWVQRQPDGSYVLNTASVDRVCPGVDASACGTLDGTARQVVALAVKPSALLLQHNGTSAVVMSGNGLYAFTVPPEARVTPLPAPSSLMATPGALSPTPAVTGVGATPPAATPVPAGFSSPDSARTPSPSPALPASSASGRPTTPVLVASLSPSAVPSGEPGESMLSPDIPTPAASILSIPPASPAPSAAVTTPIIEGVVLVGAPPAYSGDGHWVAFSARPLGGTQGSDIYVWRVGDPRAMPLTTDHASVFAAWDFGQILGSTVLPAGSTVLPTSPVTLAPVESPPAESPAEGSPPASSPPASSPPAQSAPARHSDPLSPRTRSASPSATAPVAHPTLSAPPSPVVASAPPGAQVVSFLLDPSTGAQTLITRPAVWRPVVDPTNRSVVFWAGDQTLDPATNSWILTNGRLVAADWQALVGSGDVTATPLPGPAGQAGVTDWDVRWDPSGRHLVVWIADETDPSAGRLSLFEVNADGAVGKTLLSDIVALPGLSLGSDRLVWASPFGQNGQGSTLSVYAWSEDGAGSLYGAPDPGTDNLVVAR